MLEELSLLFAWPMFFCTREFHFFSRRFQFSFLSLDHIHSLYQFLPHLYINPYHFSLFINTHSLWNACCSSLHLTVVKSILRIKMYRKQVITIIQNQQASRTSLRHTIILHTYHRLPPPDDLIHNILFCQL